MTVPIVCIGGCADRRTVSNTGGIFRAPHIAADDAHHPLGADAYHLKHFSRNGVHRDFYVLSSMTQDEGFELILARGHLFEDGGCQYHQQPEAKPC